MRACSEQSRVRSSRDVLGCHAPAPRQRALSAVGRVQTDINHERLGGEACRGNLGDIDRTTVEPIESPGVQLTRAAKSHRLRKGDVDRVGRSQIDRTRGGLLRGGCPA